ncbi:hypothetical protein SAMN05421636_1127 [Pricia antarctica]|uniref:Uncharacterized protein n=1 Tax=Pricia antarctica TaxID=641691 RepID=A0A1G7IFV0_9FLAO|nr:hypothetical protein SAMN05421636_1127 [Pricia antarctica]
MLYALVIVSIPTFETPPPQKEIDLSNPSGVSIQTGNFKFWTFFSPLCVKTYYLNTKDII